MKVHDIVALCKEYGENATLAEVLRSVQGKRKCPCPKCNGTGSIIVEYDGYPSGLPDSGFVYMPAYREEECNLCNGEGYIENEEVPI